MRVIYMAHPVSGDVEQNLADALKWYALIQAANPDDAIIAPWHTQCLIYDNNAAADYDLWLRRDCAVVERCDGIVLAGFGNCRHHFQTIQSLDFRKSSVFLIAECNDLFGLLIFA